MITIKHLLTHTSGFAYGFSAKQPVKILYKEADILEMTSLDEFVHRLAKLPLRQDPGQAYQHGIFDRFNTMFHAALAD